MRTPQQAFFIVAQDTEAFNMFEDKKEKRDVFKGVFLSQSEARALKETAYKEDVPVSVIIRRGLKEVIKK